ncbi:hypothetical protein E5206_04085 [Arthrobacter sp. PAMC25564]|uniref:hypothetical protein n=1 Tax=Arthrobacter sp. PAMC25564 TaxID=2565366 RepID=UPI0010A28DD2|nr:hypothetical protein [Arthrobacter sp. PAMC25564]QCB96208.1 hypothetical protein E5206_04085 [Arthrobacter sp. PAMC25564]
MGCDLHLVPVSFEAGRRVAGAPATVAYPPILRLGYQIGVKKSLLGKTSGLTVSVHAIDSTPSMPPFVLVYNRERLPLTVLDGVALSMVSDGDEATPPARRFVPDTNPGPDGSRTWKTEPEAWSREVSPTEGYVRLFADLPVDVLRMVALLDPPLRSLRLAGPVNPFKGMFDGR